MIAEKIDNMKNNKILLLILLLAFCLRVFYLLYYNSLPDWNQLTVDNYYPYNLALNIANGNIFGDTTYFRAPFYVYCLGLLYAVFGASLWIGRLFGLVIGIFSILLTYLIGKKVFDHKTGVLAAFIHTVYPITIFFESELLLDPLFMLLLQLALYRLLLWIENKSFRNAFWVGIFMGLAAITRPTILIWVIPLLLLIIIYKNHVLQWYKQIAFFFIALIIIIAPITIRNLIVAEDPVLIASQGGINFYIGNNPDADGVSAIMPEPLGHNWRISQIHHIAETETGKILSSGEISSFWFKKGMRWIIENPKYFINLYLKKLYLNISNLEISNNRNIYQFFQNIPLLKYNPVEFGILFSFSIVSILLLWKRNKVLKLLVILLITYIMVGSLFFFSSRFRLPMLPFYFVFSASGLILTIKCMRGNIAKTAKLFVIILITLLLSYYPIVSFSEGNSPQEMMSKGNYYYGQKDYESSLNYNRKAFKIDSLFPEVNLNIGNCFLKFKDIDSATYYYQREIEIHPLRPKSLTNLATIKLITNETQEAINLVEKAIQIQPYDLVSHQILLRANYIDKQISNDQFYITASKSFEMIKYDDIYLLNEVSVLMSNRNMLSKAEEFLIRALHSSPPPIEIDDEIFNNTFRNSSGRIKKQLAFSNFQLGYIKGLQKSYGESIQYSLKAINLDSSLTDAYINLINGYVSTNQTIKADLVLNRALKLFPSNSSLLKIK